MKVLKGILNVFGIIFAVVFSIVLVLVLIATPIISTTSSIMQPETLHNVIEEIDVEELLLSNEDVTAVLNEYGLDAETVEAIVNSEAVEESLDLYMEDIVAALEGEIGEKNLTADAIKKIAAEHMDEIVEVAKNYKGVGDDTSEEKIREQISLVVEEYADDVVELFPAPEDLGLVQTESMPEEAEVTIQVVKNLYNGTFTFAMILVSVVLSVLIILCRIKRFKGFMWLGVVFSLAAVFAFGASAIMGSIPSLIGAELNAWMSNLVGSAVTVLSGQMVTRAIILLGIALLSTAVFVVGRILLAKKKEKDQLSI